MTPTERQELSWAKNAKLVRQGIYDVGILIGAVLIAGETAKFDHEHGPFIAAIGLVVAFCLWLDMIRDRRADGKSVAFLEKALDRAELEQEVGRKLNSDELKNYGLD
jgi:hypothetical protein